MGMFSRKSKRKPGTSSSGGTDANLSPSISVSTSDGSDNVMNPIKNIQPDLPKPERNNSENTTAASTSSMTYTADSSETPCKPSLEMVPQLLVDLATAKDTHGEQAARALRILFALSEHSADEKNRERMVHDAGGRLAPVLLGFLQRCQKCSSEQYLALLVLNNVSIPAENKRAIAIEHGGALIVSRLLVAEPSCHLLAIILVNLTFVNPDMRKELVSIAKNEIIVSLVYTLWRSVQTTDKTDVGEQNQNTSVHELLALAMDEDKKMRNVSEVDGAAYYVQMFDPTQQTYPETARWAMCALKNLTRPSKDQSAAKSLVETGIVPLLLNIVTVGFSSFVTKNDSSSHSSGTPQPSEPHETTAQNSKNNIVTVENDMGAEDVNTPTLWESNTVQDAALFTLMNLAATPLVRSYLRDEDAAHILHLVADYAEIPLSSPDRGMMLLQLQSLKARIALAYLVGSEGHFGMPRLRGTSYDSKPDVSLLQLSQNEVKLLVELLANCLHKRGKDGPGGYSAATFTLKGALYAIRCLLTCNNNLVIFAKTSAMKLNCLLLKAVALHAVKKNTMIDCEAAEYASFSLYLMSNFGLRKDPFLPVYFGRKEGNSSGLLDKVMTTYMRREDITPAGYHSADQILQRIYYLRFECSTKTMAGKDPIFDFEFDNLLYHMTIGITIPPGMRRPAGAKPAKTIFDRPILRCRASRDCGKSPWDNQENVDAYPNAIIAAQQLSFGSVKVRHMDLIDDILIANNISSSANGQKTESYNFWWSWQDLNSSIQIQLKRNGSYYSNNDTTTSEKTPRDLESINEERTKAPFLRFGGFMCGSMSCVN